MAQNINWEREYQNPFFVTKNADPQKDALRFFKFVRKQKAAELNGMHVLDLGSGTGRNSNYLATLGCAVSAMEISRTAIELAKKRASELEVEITYLNQSIGEKYPYASDSFDFALDITSSNALDEKEREVYLSETVRTLKKDGLVFVRALCKDGDKNAKKLLKLFPGKEVETYMMPKSGLVERVFTENDFRITYGKYFKILKVLKKSGYTKFDGQPYKRNYLLAYLAKK